jgi:hypothetical protein
MDDQVVAVHELHKRSGDVVAVDGATFDVDRGEIFGILGRKGCGKTPPSSASRVCTSPTPARWPSSAWILGVRPARPHEGVGGPGLLLVPGAGRPTLAAGARRVGARRSPPGRGTTVVLVGATDRTGVTPDN